MAASDISAQMVKLARHLKINFSLNGRPLTHEEVFAPTGLLPGITKRADQLSSLCLGYGIGAMFEEAEGSLLGTKVIYDEVTPNALRLLCLLDAMSELMKMVPKGDTVPLDQLLYD